jgi:predicted dehydrogenase
MNRRESFAAATLGALTALRGEAWGRSPKRVGIVGAGRFGMVLARQLAALGQTRIVAMCDPDRRLLEAGASEVLAFQGEQPDIVQDYRQILVPGRMDLAVIASPDHWHALHAIRAMEAGIDIYCEKPISHTFLEGEAMVRVARERGSVVQVGLHRRNARHIEQARELVQEGKLGPVSFVRAHYHRARLPSAPRPASPPTHLDWDLWCGPAPLRPYSPGVHPRNWRRFREFSNGIVGDMGIHLLDLARWYLGLQWPRKVTSTGGRLVLKRDDANVSDTQMVWYDYGHLTLVWEHRTWGPPDNPDDDWGLTFVGEKGLLRVNATRWDFRSVDKNIPLRRVEAMTEQGADKTGATTPGGVHLQNFLDATLSRRKPLVNIEEGHLSTALCQLGTVALELGRPVVWDAERRRPIGDADADARLSRDYRKPWRYPRV